MFFAPNIFDSFAETRANAEFWRTMMNSQIQADFSGLSKTAAAIELTLPYPISANDYWRAAIVSPSAKSKTSNWHAAPRLTSAAKAYKDEVLYIARQAKIYRPISGRVAIDITLFPALPKDHIKRARKDIDNWSDNVRSIDLDNAFKVTMDALKNVVFGDDKWVWEIHARRAEPDGDARMVVIVTPIIINSVQGKLL